MAEPFLSEIRLLSFGYATRGWALCNAQVLSLRISYMATTRSGAILPAAVTNHTTGMDQGLRPRRNRD